MTGQTSGVPCPNLRHSHAEVTGPRCFPLVDQTRPLPDRVVGTATLYAFTGLCVALSGAWTAATWLAGPGALHARTAAHRARAAWHTTR